MDGSTFVGRDREVAELRRGLDDAAAGHGRLFLAVGEPGIGKTRLGDELARLAAARGARVLRGRCWEGGGAPAYWPWTQILRSYLADRPAEAVGREIGADAAGVAQLAGDLPDAVPRVAAPAALPLSEDERFWLFDSTTAFLKRAARREPLVLLVDDLHDADGPSLLLLAFLARELRDASILVLGGFRPVEARRDPAVARTLADLAREGTTLPLAGLAERDVATLVRETAGGAPAPDLVASIHRTTGGNPFFVAEVVRLLVAEGRLHGAAPSASLGIPEGVRGAIHRRLELLGDGARRVLAIAAVIGRDFDLVPLEKACRLGRDELLETLAAAVEVELIAEDPAIAGRHRFAHALVRETLYDELSAATRTRLHREIGDVLEAAWGESAEEHAAELAHHFLQAAPRARDERAVEWATRAGRRAFSSFAWEDAAGHFESALRVLDRLRSADETRRYEVLVALSAAQAKAGRLDDAVATCRLAIDLARRLRNPERFARAVLEVGAGWIDDRRFGKLAAGLLEEALDALPKDDSALRATLLARLAWQCFFDGDSKRRAALCRECVAMARRVGDRAALALALSVAHSSTWGTKPPAERLAAADEITRLSEEMGSPELTVYGRQWRFLALLEVGDLDRADREIAAIADLAGRTRHSGAPWLAAVFRALRAAMAGRFDEGERLAAEAFEIGRRARSGSAIETFGGQLFSLRWLQGRLSELEEAARKAAEDHPGVSVYRAALALVHAEAGRFAEARREVDAVARGDFASLDLDEGWPFSVAYLSTAIAIIGDAAPAARLYELVAPRAGMNLGVIAFLGPADLYLGLLAHATGRFDDALGHFDVALAASERMQARPFAALARLATARTLVACGDAREWTRASQLVDGATRLAQELGMAGVLESADRLANGLFATRRSDRAPAAAGGGNGSRTRSITLLPAPSGAPPAPIAGGFRRDAKVWRIEFRGEVSRLRDSTGLRYVATLLSRPGEEVHTLYLLAAAADATDADARDADAREPGLRARRPGDAGPVVDGAARSAYRRRIAELREVLDEAAAAGNAERAAAAEREMAELAAELTGATGLGGRSRRAGSAVERSRVNVTKSVKSAIRKIAESNPSLGHHLAACIKTGTFCVYRPDPAVPVHWTF
ncbi:MAG TPA: AAA family ATPase [Candidatus Binatia bacterium]|nr:AAA family ATPase [Candidatus Binatia bacterium]